MPCDDVNVPCTVRISNTLQLRTNVMLRSVRLSVTAVLPTSASLDDELITDVDSRLVVLITIKTKKKKR